MTIVLDPATQKLYSLYWGESDNFEKLRCKEIMMDEAKKSCSDGQDYVKIQRLDEALIQEAA